MQTIQKSADGKVILTKRANGLFSVSRQVQVWSGKARMYVLEWQTVEKNLIEPTARLLFAATANNIPAIAA